MLWLVKRLITVELIVFIDVFCRYSPVGKPSSSLKMVRMLILFEIVPNLLLIAII